MGTTMCLYTLLGLLTSSTLAAGGGKKIVLLLSTLLAFLGNGGKVQFCIVTNVMFPSLRWMDAITMYHHQLGPCGNVHHDPGPDEGGARHYAARHYPHQREEGRRHHLSPHQQN